MIDTLLSLATPIALLFIAAAVRPYINYFRKRQALRRVAGEPLYVPGAPFRRVYDPVGGADLMGAGHIVSIAHGRVLLESAVGDQLPLTVIEFESLHVVMRATNSVSDVVTFL